MFCRSRALFLKNELAQHGKERTTGRQKAGGQDQQARNASRVDRLRCASRAIGQQRGGLPRPSTELRNHRVVFGQSGTGFVELPGTSLDYDQPRMARKNFLGGPRERRDVMSLL
jgi:hypothetical protein